MILSDTEIERRLDRAELDIHGLANPDLQIQPASVDLRLAGHVQVASAVGTDNPLVPDDLVFDELRLEDGEDLVVAPGEFMLGSTIERLDIPPNLVAHVTGRSSIGRRGLLVHVSAGLCDPGWEGQVTLELVNLSPAPVRIEPGTRVCQATFTEIKGTVSRDYGERTDSHYQGQTGPVRSRDT